MTEQDNYQRGNGIEIRRTKFRLWRAIKEEGIGRRRRRRIIRKRKREIRKKKRKGIIRRTNKKQEKKKKEAGE